MKKNNIIHEENMKNLHVKYENKMKEIELLGAEPKIYYSSVPNLNLEKYKNRTDYPDTNSVLADKIDEAKLWYNGYLFGNTEIYNPWSILNYADDKKLNPYWVNTSGNELIINSIKTSFL